MGVYFSSALPQGPSATVISWNGTLKEYPVPVNVAKVMEEGLFSSRKDWFVCSSDSLYVDQFIPALEWEDELVADQIYFVIPASKLDNPLAASDMAEIAVKASVAIQNVDDSRHRKKKGRISPVLENCSDESKEAEDAATTVFYTFGKANTNPNRKPKQKTKPSLLPRSNSGKKLQISASEWARPTVRPFGLRLSTIYEGTAV